MTDTWPLIETPADELRVIRFKPAFHRCSPNPRTNYGIGSVTMLWVLKVDDWAMTWDVHTDWGLPDEAFKTANPDCTHPMHQTGYPRVGATGGAVDWHSPVPRWDDQAQAQETCPITGTACYLDSGFMLGSDLFDLLCAEGDEAVWKRLRALLDDARGEDR